MQVELSRDHCDDKGTKGYDEQDIFSVSLLIIAQLVAAVAESFTLNPADMVLTFNMEHRILGRTSPPCDSSFCNANQNIIQGLI